MRPIQKFKNKKRVFFVQNNSQNGTYPIRIRGPFLCLEKVFPRRVIFPADSNLTPLQGHTAAAGVAQRSGLRSSAVAASSTSWSLEPDAFGMPYRHPPWDHFTSLPYSEMQLNTTSLHLVCNKRSHHTFNMKLEWPAPKDESLADFLTAKTNL